MKDVDQIKQKSKIFCEEKTYSFIKTISGSYYNGYITKTKEDHIMFDDNKFGEFPIIYSDIELIAPSNRKDGDNHGN